MAKTTRIAAASLFAAGVAGAVVATTPPVSMRPPATAPVAAPAVEPSASAVKPELQLNWQTPGTLKWTFDSPSVSSVQDYRPNAIDLSIPLRNRPISTVTLFENKGMLAEWSNDGRLRYRFAVPNPLNAGVGGQLNSDAVKVTLTWPRRF